MVITVIGAAIYPLSNYDKHKKAPEDPPSRDGHNGFPAEPRMRNPVSLALNFWDGAVPREPRRFETEFPGHLLIPRYRFPFSRLSFRIALRVFPPPCCGAEESAAVIAAGAERSGERRCSAREERMRASYTEHLRCI